MQLERYHLEVAVDGEEVISKVEEGQRAAHPPDVNGLSEGQAEGDFWSSSKGGKVKNGMNHIFMCQGESHW